MLMGNNGNSGNINRKNSVVNNNIMSNGNKNNIINDRINKNKNLSVFSKNNSTFTDVDNNSDH
jgi:hypothetical protein